MTETAERQGWMGLLARAPAERLAALMPPAPGFDWLRAPEIGGVMMRGRAGGTGGPFNLGEVTVTRCALRLGSGEVGHACVMGRDKAHAQRAALVDALMQGAMAAAIRAQVLDPLARDEDARPQRPRGTGGGNEGGFLHHGQRRDMMRQDSLTGGFTDAPQQGARAFRAALEAMARPGTLHEVAGAQAPAPVSPAAAVLLLTLCDRETPLYLAPGHDGQAVRDWIAFHIGAPLATPDAAMFALGRWEALGPKDRYRIGTPDYPDRSVMLICETDSLAAAGARLTGPGIRDVAHLSLPEIAAFQANRALFPLGWDCFFTCGAQLAALPRTTNVEAL